MIEGPIFFKKSFFKVERTRHMYVCKCKVVSAILPISKKKKKKKMIWVRSNTSDIPDLDYEYQFYNSVISLVC